MGASPTGGMRQAGGELRPSDCQADPAGGTPMLFGHCKELHSGGRGLELRGGWERFERICVGMGNCVGMGKDGRSRPRVIDAPAGAPTEAKAVGATHGW